MRINFHQMIFFLFTLWIDDKFKVSHTIRFPKNRNRSIILYPIIFPSISNISTAKPINLIARGDQLIVP